MMPRGKGVYLRDSPARDPAASVAWCAAAGVEWAAVNVVHPATMRALRSAGVAVYVFGLPSQWDPESWRTTLARSLEVAIATGAEGILADPENGWGGPTSTEGVALAHELQLASRVMSVGVTTNDGRRPMAATIARLAPRVWFSVQTYDHQRGETYERPAALVAAWEARLGAGRVLASVGSLGPESGARGLTGLLAALPPTWPAAILWYDSLPHGAELAAVRAWVVGRLGPAGYIVLALLGILALLGVLLVMLGAWAA